MPNIDKLWFSDPKSQAWLLEFFRSLCAEVLGAFPTCTYQFTGVCPAGKSAEDRARELMNREGGYIVPYAYPCRVPLVEYSVLCRADYLRWEVEHNPTGAFQYLVLADACTDPKDSKRAVAGYVAFLALRLWYQVSPTAQETFEKETPETRGQMLVRAIKNFYSLLPRRGEVSWDMLVKANESSQGLLPDTRS